MEIYNPSIDLILIDGHQHYIITPNINVDFGNVFFSSLVPLQNTIGVAHWYIGVSKVQFHIVKNILTKSFFNQTTKHSKWDLVGYSGGSPGLEKAVKRWGRPIGPFVFSVYLDVSP